MRYATLAQYGALLLASFIDSRLSRWPKGLKVEREFGSRFAVGAETEVRLNVTNNSLHPFTLVLKDEYPPQMKLTDLREARLRVEPQTTATLIYTLLPPKRGRFEFGQVAVRYLSRLGLVW